MNSDQLQRYLARHKLPRPRMPSGDFIDPSATSERDGSFTGYGPDGKFYNNQACRYISRTTIVGSESGDLAGDNPARCYLLIENQTADDGLINWDKPAGTNGSNTLRGASMNEWDQRVQSGRVTAIYLNGPISGIPYLQVVVTEGVLTK